MVHLMLQRQPVVWHDSRIHSLSRRQWIVATLVLSLGCFAGLLATAGVTMRARLWSTNAMLATTLAHDKLEALKALKAPAGHRFSGVDTEAYRSFPHMPHFKRQTTIAPDTPAPHLTTVTVKVFWGSDRHVVQLRTILAE